MVPSKGEVCVQQLKQVAQDLSKGYAPRAAKRLEALCQLAQHPDTFDGWATLAVPFTLLLQPSATGPEVSAPYQNLLESLLDAATQQLSENDLQLLASGTSTLLLDASREREGKWPLQLQVFSQLQDAAQNGPPGSDQLDLHVPDTVSLANFSAAVALCKAAAKALTCILRRQGFVGPSEEVLRALADLSLHSEDTSQAEVFVVALDHGLRQRWTAPRRNTLEWVQKAVGNVMLRYCRNHGGDEDVTVLDMATCGVLDFLAGAGFADAVIRVIWVVLKHPIQRAKLRQCLLQLLLACLRSCSNVSMQRWLLQELVTEPSGNHRTVCQMALLRFLLDNVTSFDQLGIGTSVAERACEWIQLGSKEFTTSEDVQALSGLAVSLISQALCKRIHLPLENMQSALAQLIQRNRSTNGNEVHRQDLLLCLCVDCLFRETLGGCSEAQIGEVCETLVGCNSSADSRAVGIMFLPFVFALQNKRVEDCVVRLVGYCNANCKITRTAVAQAVGFLTVAFGSEVDRSTYSACVGEACFVANRAEQIASMPCHFGGSIDLQLSLLEPFCGSLLEESDPHFLKVAITSLTTLLKAIDEDCIANSQSTLVAVLQCVLASGHTSEKTKLMGSFAKPYFVSEWAGLPLVDAEKKIIQEIIRGSASKAHGAQLLDKLNATIESKENRMRLLCGMMTLLVRDEYAVVGMVLEQLVSQEGKLVADLVLGDEMEYFEVLFMQRPDVMDAVSDLANLAPSALPRAYLPYALRMCWKQSKAARHGPQALAAMIKRLGKDGRTVLLTELEASLVSAIWRAQMKTVRSFLETVEEKSGIDHSEWVRILSSMTENLAEKVILASGDESNWMNSNSSILVTKRCRYCLDCVAEACRVEKELVNRLLKQPVFMNKVFTTIDSRLSTGDHVETRLQAWRALLVVLKLLTEEENLMKYSPHSLAIIRAGLKTESNEESAVEALESLSVIMEAGMLGIAKEHIHILQEVVVVLSPTLRMKGDAFKAGYCLLESLASASTTEGLKRIAAITYNILQSNQSERNREPPFEALRLSGFFDPSGASCPLFSELCSCLASDSGPVLLDSLHSMLLFLHKNSPWVKRLECGRGDNSSESNIKPVIHVLQSLLVCLGRTRRSEEGRNMNKQCARCLGLIGAIDPGMLSLKTALPLKIIESDVELVTTVMDHLIRVLFSSDLGSAGAAAHALGQILECKITKPLENGQNLDGVSVRSVINNSMTLSHWTSSSPPSVEIVGNSVTSEELCDIGELTLRNWILKWLFFLQSKACGSLASALNLVIAAEQFDMPAMVCLFPYLLHNVITEGKPEAQDSIVKGLIAVIQEASLASAQHKQRIDTQKCQMVFLLLECLHSCAWQPSNCKRKSSKIKEMLEKIDRRQLAQAAFHCGSHTRALQYMESLLCETKQGGLNPSAGQSPSFSDDEASFLMQIYRQIDEPDGLMGLVRLRSGGLSTFDRITIAEQQGNWDHAISLWESVASMDIPERDKQHCSLLQGDATPSESERRDEIVRGHLQCLLRAGRLEQALDKAQSILACGGYKPGSIARVASAGVEAAWKLGQWDDVHFFLSKNQEQTRDGGDGVGQQWSLNPHEDWNLRLGEILYGMQKPVEVGLQSTTFENQVMAAEAAVLRLLPARAAESYGQCYPFLMRLQTLAEIKVVRDIAQNESGIVNKRLGRNKLQWDRKLKIADGTFQSHGSLLHLRRQLASILGDSNLEHERFMEMARVARKSGSHKLAVAAWHMRLPGSALEYIKAMRSEGKHELAMEELEVEIARLKSGGSVGQLLHCSSSHFRAKLVLLLAQLQTGRCSQQHLKRTYEEAKQLDSSWAKPSMEFAKYLDGLYRDARLEADTQAMTGRKDRLQGRSRLQPEVEEHYARMLPQIFENYARASCLSDKHARDCLSRILTLYFEYGDSAAKRISVLCSGMEDVIHKTMLTVQKEVPSSLWYLVLPHLVSRLCHPWPKVQLWIEKLLMQIVDDFPHHTLWSLAAVMNSSIKDRKATAKRIIGQLGVQKGYSSRGRGLASGFKSFVEELMNLCLTSLTGTSVEVDGLQNFPQLYALLGNLSHDIVVPVQGIIRGTVVPVSWGEQRVKPSGGVATIVGMKPGIKILQSLMKPRKIVFIGSDGVEYPFLAKPKDDLRKDFRLMEYCSVLNDYFGKDAQARKRKLRLRTFMVLPLKEDCGILEWVDGLASLRSLCEGTYREEPGGYPTKKHFMQMHEKEGWLELVLKELKPCLHKRFLRGFPTPDRWQNARLSFARTCAAWSMVGHTVGLGDRHTENVNLDTLSGDVVHVDFGCLFDQGLTLAVPEVTPFRLTQNMVDAFGVSGVEGVFMNSAAIVLKVLREHREPLLTCLNSFLHDPLVKWVENKSSVEVENPYAKDAVLTIEGRLMGKLIGVKSERSSILSYEGHAEALVKEATNKTNLSNMYIWWMPWL